MSDLPNKIKELRNKLELSQKQFAEDLGISRSAVAQIESGKTIPSFQIIYKIVKLYNVDSTYFFLDESLAKNDSDNNVQNSVHLIQKEGKAEFEFSRNDLDILAKIPFGQSIDEILQYVDNTSTRNKMLLKVYRDELTTFIESYNKLCSVAEILGVTNNDRYTAKFEKIDCKKYIQGVFEDINPQEWNENYKFDNANILLILHVLGMKNSIEHINHLTNIAIDYLHRAVEFKKRSL